MMEMIERVARAIIGPHKQVPRGCSFTLAELREVRWQQASEAEKQDAINAARAAIAEMREPTREMVIVGSHNIAPWWSPAMRNTSDYGNCRKAADSAFSGMIDAALEEAA